MREVNVFWNLKRRDGEQRVFWLKYEREYLRNLNIGIMIFLRSEHHNERKPSQWSKTEIIIH